MRRSWFLPLTALALALSGLLATELQAPLFLPAPMDASQAHPFTIPANAKQRNSASQRETWVATILARPLLSPTRRFPSAPVSKAPANDVPRLTGVLVSEAGAGAIFAGADGKPVYVKAGDHVGPYLVRAISAGQVTVQGPAGLAILHPVLAPSASKPERSFNSPLPAPFYRGITK
jgi:hypothetical protein